MRSISLFQILVSLGTIDCVVYSHPLAGTSDDAASTSASILPNRPTGARFPKRTSPTRAFPSAQARVTGGPQARAQVEVDPDEYLSNLGSYYSAYAEEPGTSLLAEMASYTANNNPDVVDEAYLSSAEAMLSAATVAAGENAGALTEAIGDAFTALFDYKSDGNNDEDNEGVETVQNGVTYWSQDYNSDATSAQTEAMMTTINGVPYTGTVTDGQTSWTALTGESGQTSPGPSTTISTSSSSATTTASQTSQTGTAVTIEGEYWEVLLKGGEQDSSMSLGGDSGQTITGLSTTGTSSSSSLTTTSASEQTGVVMTTVNGIPYAYSMVDGQTSWISLNSDSGQTTTGPSTTGTASSLTTTAMTSQQTEINGGASDLTIQGLVACPTFTGENGMYIKCFGGSAQTTGTAVGGETSLTTTSAMTTSAACPACDAMNESYVPSAERTATT